MNKILEIKNLSYQFDEDEYQSANEFSLDNVNFSILQNEIIGITGESGSGKSTLGKLLCGFLKPSSGKILLNEKKMNKKETSIQFLFQNSDDLLNPERTVQNYIDEIVDTFLPKEEIINSLQISKDLFNNKCKTLSGGERQRIALARILNVNPQIIILDEPFAAQDENSNNRILDFLKHINKNYNKTIICISHDLKSLQQLADKTIVMFAGQIIEMNKTSSLFNKQLHPYTKLLFEATDYKLNNIKMYSLKNNSQTPACKYYTRCEKHFDKCIDEIEEKYFEDRFVRCNLDI